MLVVVLGHKGRLAGKIVFIDLVGNHRDNCFIVISLTYTFTYLLISVFCYRCLIL